MDDALKTYSVPALIALAVMLLIQLVKSDKIPITIPPRARPWVAIGLALASAIATRVAQGFPLGQAVAEGLGAGLGAVGLFEAGASLAPKDEQKSEPPKAPPGSLIMMLSMLFALVAFGCGAAEKVQHVVQMSSEVIARAEPCLVVQYEAQQEDCLKLEPVDEARACVDRVKATWKPIVDALVELRTVRCEIEPEKCEAKEN